jgi:two-component system, NarL family, nitrate/nitrite response regulator NarL
MRIVLCDDNRLLADALAVALEARGHQALAIATTAADGVAAVASYKPDACLLDLHFPGGGSGLVAARAIRERSPGTAVLVLSGLTDADASAEAREIGVSGFLGKDQNIDQIADALDVIAAGGVVFDPRLARRRPAAVPARRARDTAAHQLAALTEREREVLRRISAGQSTAQMAREMDITTGTLRTYVRNSLAKLGVHSRLEAAALVSRDGLPGELPGEAQSA